MDEQEEKVNADIGDFMFIKWLKRNSKIFLRLQMIFFVFVPTIVYAQGTDVNPVPFSFNFNVQAAEDGQDVVSSLQILFLLTIISLAPSILVMMTSFTRIVVVLHFLRSALGTQQTPPNQILIGLALFLTFFIMGPTITEVNDQAIQPYAAGQINQTQAIERGMEPIRRFMYRQVNAKDLGLFLDIGGIENVPEVDEYPTPEQIPSRVLIPAFVISELRTAFIIGFIIYIPFIVIDMVVASTLMSMGMMMLPPVMISLPFKVLLFIMVDGWNLVIGNLVQTFR